MNEPLLKIHRQYSRDEAIATLMAELRKANFTNGQLIAENAELQHTISQRDKTIEKLSKQLSEPRLKLTKDDLIEERITALKESNAAHKATNKRLKGDIDLWRSKYLNMLAASKKQENY